MKCYDASCGIKVILLLLAWVICGEAAALPPGASADYILDDAVKSYNNSESLPVELKRIRDLSLQLLQRLTADGKLAGAAELAQIASSDKQYVSTLDAARRVAEERPTLPVLARRILFAQLLLKYLEQGKASLNDQQEQEIFELAKGFYSLHVAGVVRRGLLEYLHISKSGGTSFSTAAKQNRCRQPGGIGQLETLGDLPRWINLTAFEEATGSAHVMWAAYGQVQRDTASPGCSRRERYVRGQRYNYVSNEYTLHGGLGDMGRTHVCPQMVNVVTLRHPLRRLESHLHYMLPFIRRTVRRNGEGEGGESGDAVFQRVFCSGDPGVWERVAPPVADNYNVRSFLGESGFHTPLGGIGDQHVAVARNNLLQFDLVLDLDAGQDASALLMSQGLGWGTTLSEVHSRAGDRVSSKHGFDQAADCPREGLAELLPRQQPDMQLYRLGRVLSFLDVVFLDLARQAGQTPEGVAAAARGEREGAVEGAEGKEGGAEEGAAGADCGILGRSRRRDNGKGSDTDGRHMR